MNGRNAAAAVAAEVVQQDIGRAHANVSHRRAAPTPPRRLNDELVLPAVQVCGPKKIKAQD